MADEERDETLLQRLAYAQEHEGVESMVARMKAAGWTDDTFAGVRNWSEDADPDSELWRFRA